MIKEELFAGLGGLKPAVGSVFQPLTAPEIGLLEAEIGAAIPEDYREFLLKYGAASFGTLTRFGSIAMLPKEYSETRKRGPFDYFYGAHRPPNPETISLIWNLEILKDRMPVGFLPIGDDGVGNQVCISCKGPTKGKVFLWDHHNEWDEEEYEEEHGRPMPEKEKFSNLYLIANSFEDFLTRLSSYE